MTTTAERTQAEADLMSLVVFARRCPYVVARFAEDAPTEWDERHREIDAVLDDLIGK